MSKSTPTPTGFYMPAEWEKHEATWIAWPHDTITFPQGIDRIEKTFSSVIYYLHQCERIELLVLNSVMQNRALKILQQNNVDTDKIVFHIVNYADVWIRDYGPTFLTNNKSNSSWVKWTYNAYGEKFKDLVKDNEVPYQLENYINLSMFESNIIMEGGAVDVNGKGSLLTTEECLLNPNRNKHLNKQQTESKLKELLGVNNIIWLKNGIVGDHTDGHIDEVARFINEDTIAIACEESRDDPNYEILDINLHILQNATDQNGNPFNIIKLPMPKMNYDNGEKAPVSYANFYIANEFILAPTFKHQNDSLALSVLQEAFPNRKVVGIDCEDVVYGGGTIHCITQQQPASFK